MARVYEPEIWENEKSQIGIKSSDGTIGVVDNNSITIEDDFNPTVWANTQIDKYGYIKTI